MEIEVVKICKLSALLSSRITGRKRANMLTRESLPRVWMSVLGDLVLVVHVLLKADRTSRAGSIPQMLGIVTRSTSAEISSGC
jgi:hypothetical protein